MAANRVLGVLLGTTLGTSDTPLLRCEFRRGGDLIFANPPPHTHTHTVRSVGHIQVTLVSSIFCSKSELLFIAEGRPGHREHRNCAGRAEQFDWSELLPCAPGRRVGREGNELPERVPRSAASCFWLGGSFAEMRFSRAGDCFTALPTLEQLSDQ